MSKKIVDRGCVKSHSHRSLLEEYHPLPQVVLRDAHLFISKVVPQFEFDEYAEGVR